MPIPITGHEKAPEYINALMVNFRELLVGLEDEGDHIRYKLDRLKHRTRITKPPGYKQQQQQQQRNHTTSQNNNPTPISTSTIPTDSTTPPNDTSDSPPADCGSRRRKSLPATNQVPPVRPPRQSDLFRNNLESILSKTARLQVTQNIRDNQLKNRSKTMASAAIGAVKTRGALIVLEGVDRVGKSTLAKRLVEHLEKTRNPVTYCRFPDRNTPVGKLIDEYLRSSAKQVDDHVMHLLFSANRWELSKKIRTTLDKGTSVIVDRYAYSGIAYSSAKSGLPLKWCCEMERGLPRPDLVIYLELKREAQHQRDGFGDERFETEEMQDSVRLQYEQVMDVSKETWLKVEVDNKKPDQVLAEVIMPVKRCLEAVGQKELGTLDFFDVST